MVAGHGSAAYLVGWGSRGLTVWRTEDGRQWTAAQLPLGGTRVRDQFDLEVTIAAGPRGVVVAGISMLNPPRFPGVYVWSSPDGRSFVPPVHVRSGPGTTTLPVVEVTATGFLLAVSVDGQGTTVYESADGTGWRDITAGLTGVPVVGHLAGNGTTTVLLPDKARPGEPQAWYRRGDGGWQAGTMDPGRLPDAGVVPAEEREVNAVHRWGNGFLAVGNTYADEGRERSVMVWYTVDGALWTRMPVRANGFDSAAILEDVASNRERTVLLAVPADFSEQLLTWQAPAPHS
ncbi:hypothetical protein GCM10010399_90560 [Dactylosporangium fulvum]